VRGSLFVPCFVDHLTPQVRLATDKMLKRLGHEVEFHSAQTCCGQPSFHSGPRSTGDIERILVLGAHGPKEL
jgi:L-lactate dehydrogenase complex protein LldE